MKYNLSSSAFQRLVQTLKVSNKTITTIEQCCGGLISTGILSRSGASNVYIGGSIVYNTKQCLPLLFNNNNQLITEELLNGKNNTNTKTSKTDTITEIDEYIESKIRMTSLVSVEYCKQMTNVDYVIVEGGASGPTFRPNNMTTGFAVIAIAGKDPMNGTVSLLGQTVIHSTNNIRQSNMKLFADTAAEFANTTIMKNNKTTVSTSETKTEQDKKKENSVTIVYQDLRKEVPVNNQIYFDRASHLRSKSVEIEQMKQSDSCRYVILHSEQILVDKSCMTKLAYLSYKQINDLLYNSNQNDSEEDNNEKTNIDPSFLGIQKCDNGDGTITEIPTFAYDISSRTIAIDNLSLLFSNNYTCVDTRTQAPLFNTIDNEIALHSSAIVQWQRRAKFCSLCGSVTTFIHSGTCSKCTNVNCNNWTWPRQDPSMIAIITSNCNNRVLLSRNKRHPPGVYTLLAGFVEAGETFEQAVSREVFEETGIHINKDSIQYIGSQPWPFPQSCMIGFTATADDVNQTLNIDPKELDDAQWFDKDTVLYSSNVPGATMRPDIARAAFESDSKLSLLIPPKGVIARKLIDLWLYG